MAGQHVGDCRRGAAIRHFLQLDAGRILEQLPARSEIAPRRDADGDGAGFLCASSASSRAELIFMSALTTRMVELTGPCRRRRNPSADR